MATGTRVAEACERLIEDISNLNKEKVKLLVKERRNKGLNDTDGLRLFEIEETIKTHERERRELCSVVDQILPGIQTESKSFGTADRAWIEAVTGIDASPRDWEPYSGDNVNGYYLDESIRPSDDFKREFEKISKAVHMTTEAGRRIYLNLFLMDIILRPEFKSALRIYPELEMSVENLQEGLKKRKLGGKIDYTVGFGKYTTLLGETMELSIFDKAPPRELHLLAMEAKTSFDQSDLWQCIAETAALYKARVDAQKIKPAVWSILSNANCWKFLQVNDQGFLSESKEWMISLKKYCEEEILPVYRFIYFVVKKCHGACTPMPSPYASTEQVD